MRRLHHSVRSFLGRLFGRRKPEDEIYEERAFRALVRKFENIRYLVEQKATVDVIEKTPVAICITNEDHLYEYVNPAYCKLYGYEFDELIGNSFTIVVPEEYRAQMIELHDRFMHREYELEGLWDVVRKDGTKRKILANAAYIVDSNGRPKKVTFVLDVTVRTQALEAIDRLKGRATAIRERVLTLADACDAGGHDSLGEELRSVAGAISELTAEAAPSS